MHNVTRFRVVLDTDTFNEVDDQFTLAYAFLSPDQINLEACYAAPFLNARSLSAEDGMEKSYQEIHVVSNLLKTNFDGHIFRGATHFLESKERPVESDATRDLIARAMQSSQEDPLHVVGIAAATNLASALIIEPRIKEFVRFYWLGGSPLYWRTADEFNLKQDVLSAQVLFESGVDLTLIPCKNVAEHMRVSSADLKDALLSPNPLCDFLLQRFDQYMEEKDFLSKPLWDVVAMALLVNPDWVPCDGVDSPLLRDDKTWGGCVHGHKIKVAREIRRDAIFRDLCRKLNEFS
ncbi:nucleoside hydrolase [Coraliomargarita sp. SDUM461004]|uniref:Nucleoside hydrolase n=1 Tax=Thalassobacterium sedimentorum TaxID=3041258 RepID=A0ABU1AJD8_9BACT|nr:nucleoside hydrolase [Coraliomargarita sp. SDUM461004]MDQ8194936.1 nucleoside hydrolase [Coraliomargarita sp. SDUM461004]